MEVPIYKTCSEQNYNYNYGSENPQCDTSHYALDHVYSTSNYHLNCDRFNEHCLQLQYRNAMVEKIIMESSYGFQSLVAETGGTLGFTLGLSGYGIAEYLATKKWKQVMLVPSTLAFWLIFVHYATQSFIIYLDEPLSTEVSIVKGNTKDEFPHLTFCKPIFLKDHHKLALELLQNHQKPSNQSFSIDDLFEIQDIQDISDPYINNNGKVTYLRKDSIWSNVYHKYFGACYTLDIRKDSSLAIGKGPVKLGFESSRRWNVYMHDSEDFSSLPRSAKSIKKLYYGMTCRHYKVKKSKYETVPTNQYPCGTKHFKACQEYEVFQKIKEMYNCHVTMLVSGKHFKMNESTSVCSNNITVLALKMLQKPNSKCQKATPCKYSMYSIFSNDLGLKNIDPCELSITMDEYLIVHQSVISYDMINLIGEIGGTLGLFLGWSSLFFMETLFGLASKRSAGYRKLSIFIFLIIFAYWSSAVIGDYSQEAKATELNPLEEIYPPHVTICKIKCFTGSAQSGYENDCKLIFKDWLNEKCPSSINSSSYMESVRNCLQFEDSDDILSDLMEYSDEHHLPLTLLKDKTRSYLHPYWFKMWKKVFHEKYGPCYTWDSLGLTGTKWER